MPAEWATVAGEVVLAAGLDGELRDLQNHEVHHAYRRETVLPIMPRGEERGGFAHVGVAGVDCITELGQT